MLHSVHRGCLFFRCLRFRPSSSRTLLERNRNGCKENVQVSFWILRDGSCLEVAFARTRRNLTRSIDSIIDEFFSCLRRRRIVCLEEIIQVAVFSRRRKNFYVEEIDLKALVALCWEDLKVVDYYREERNRLSKSVCKVSWVDKNIRMLF